LAAAGVGAAAVISILLACGLYASYGWLLAPATGWLCARRLSRGAHERACLELDPDHGWMLQCGTTRRRLRLLRAWPAFGWVSLRFAACAPTGSDGLAIKRGQGATPQTVQMVRQGEATPLSFDCGSVSKENMLELTVWRSSVSASDWRRLRVLIACGPARPAALAGSAAP